MLIEYIEAILGMGRETEVPLVDGLGGLRRRQLSEEVAAHLRQAILSGVLVPGQSVKAESVGEELEVSATPVREALQALRVEGFLRLVPRKGFTVAHLDATDILDIFEAYALIAGELTARAAERSTDEQIASLRGVHAQLIEAAEAGHRTRFEELNDEFHERLYVLSGSHRLHWLLGSFLKYVPHSFFSQFDGWPQESARQHNGILEAVASRDVASARTQMSQHIRRSGAKLADSFESRQGA